MTPKSPIGDTRRITIVTGAFPPDVCGVGDYTRRLVEAASPSWQVLVEREWRLRAAPGIVRRLLATRPTDVVVQYPTQGYGWSLVPHLLVVFGWVTRRYRPVFMLHEFGSLSGKARLTLALASHFACGMFFTTPAERDKARASRFFARNVSTAVVGILSNIPLDDNPPPFASRSIDLAYFGHIRPNKGLERFLNVASTLRDRSSALRICVIGEIPAGYEAFGDMVARRCEATAIDLILGLTDDEAGAILRDVKLLYLPYPDGASARRGTLLAGLGNGALVASTIGEATSAELRRAIIACAGDESDALLLTSAIGQSEADARALGDEGRRYIRSALPRDWAHVAQLYERALAGEQVELAPTEAAC
jgi:glycosyltransferase involved in cell wall biosynthesis